MYLGNNFQATIWPWSIFAGWKFFSGRYDSRWWNMLFPKTTRELPPKHHRFQQVQISYIISRDLIIQVCRNANRLSDYDRSSSANFFCQKARKCFFAPAAAMSSTSFGVNLNSNAPRYSFSRSSFELVVTTTTPWSIHHRSKICPTPTLYFFARFSKSESHGPGFAFVSGAKGAYAAVAILPLAWYDRRLPCWR